MKDFSPSRRAEGTPPSWTFSLPQTKLRRWIRTKAAKTVAIVFTPAAPIVQSIASPIASPARSIRIGVVSIGSSAMKTT